MWESRVGRPVSDLEHHLVYAAFRMAVILVRLADLLGQSGSLPSELAADMAMNNRGIQYLRHTVIRPDRLFWDADKPEVRSPYRLGPRPSGRSRGLV